MMTCLKQKSGVGELVARDCARRKSTIGQQLWIGLRGGARRSAATTESLTTIQPRCTQFFKGQNG